MEKSVDHQEAPLPERKAVARKTVSSLYARVQDPILRHSGTVQILVPEHEVQEGTPRKESFWEMNL